LIACKEVVRSARADSNRTLDSSAERLQLVLENEKLKAEFATLEKLRSLESA
jgi:hypothetical protein